MKQKQLNNYTRRSRWLLHLVMLFALLATGVSPAWADAKTLPYSYGFENNDLAAEGWTTANPSGKNSSEFGIVSAAKKTGNNGFRFSSYNDQGDNTQYLISPELNAPNGVVVSFQYAVSSTSTSGEKFKVGYSTTDTDIAHFTFGSEYAPTSMSWAEYEETFPAGTKYIAIYYYPKYQYRLFVDDFSFTAPPSCIKPSSFGVTSLGATSATLSWTAEGQDTWDIVYSTVSNFNPDSETPISVNTNPTTINSLSPNTTYYAYVRANCGGGDYSDWSNKISFTTAYGVPFSQDFTSSTSSLPTKWERYTGNMAQVIAGTANLESTSSGWSFANNYALTGYHAKLNIYGTGCKYWLVSPNIEIGTNYQLTFNAALTKNNSSNAAQTTGTDDKFAVLISTDNGSTWTQLALWDNAGSERVLNNIATAGEEVSLSLASYNDQTIKIAFYGESTSSNADNDIHIDDISIDAMPACPKPTGLKVDSYTHNSATLSWTKGSNETEWKVIWGAAGFDPESNDPLVAHVIDNVTTNPYTLEDLSSVTEYDVYVKAVKGEDVSSVSNKANFTTRQLAVDLTTGSFADDFESANNWAFVNGTLTNAWTIGTAAKNGGEKGMYISNNGGTTNAYDNSSATMVYATKLFTLAAGKYDISYDWLCYGESTYDYLRAAIIPEAELSAGTSVISGFSDTGLPTGWIAIDGSSKLNLSNAFATKAVEATIPSAGNYMVVFGWRNDGSGGSNPPAAIDNFSMALQTCPKPTDLKVDSYTYNTATLSWTAGSDETEWKVIYGAAGFNPESEGTTINGVTDNPYTLTGLTAVTEYDVYVKAVKGVNVSAVSNKANFTTDVQYPAPTGLEISNLTTTSATLTWTAGSDTQWEVAINITGATPTEAGTVVNAATYDFSDLTTETTYYAFVRSKHNTEYSAWSAACEFTPSASVNLTVNDDTVTDTNFPVYLSSEYANAHARFIIPSTELEDVQNGSIKKLTFYSNQATTALGNFIVYVAETDNTTFTNSDDVTDYSGMTQVYTGSLSVSGNKMTVVFGEPFAYTNKNLLIAFKQTAKSYNSCTWYGKTQASSTAKRKAGNSAQYAQFLPKTTINYIPYVAPTNPVMQVTDPESNVMGDSPVDYDFGLMETAETRNFTIQNTAAGSLTVKSITATNGYLLSIGENEPAANIGSTVIGTSGDEPVVLKIKQSSTASSGVITITTDVDGNDVDETYVINVSGVVRDNDKLYVSDFSSKPSGWNTLGTWSFSEGTGAQQNTAWETIGASTAYLYTPKVTVAAGEKFIFEAKGNYSQYPTYQHLRLEYSTDGENWTAIGNEVTLTDTWKSFTVNTPNNFVEGDYYVALHGCRVNIRKFYGGTEVPEPVLALSPTTKAFGLVTNAEAQTQVFTVSNSGKAALNNLTVAVPSGFSITEENGDAWVNTHTVAANDGSQTFKVTMNTNPGIYSGNITIDGVYGDPSTSIEQKTIAISGAVRDAECLFADFNGAKANRVPTEWSNTNWEYDYTYLQAAYSGTSTLITEKLGVSAGQKLIFLGNKPYNDATLGIFYSANNEDWTEVTPAAISTAATNTDIYYEVSVGDGDGLIPVGDYFIKFVGTKYFKLDDISYFKKPLAGKFEMYEYDANADAPHLGTEITENQTVNLGNNVTETQTIKYVVKNAGTAAMTVTGSKTGDITIAPTDPVNLGIGETQEYTITLTYDAENLGAKSGVATISAGELGEYTVTVSGTTRDGSKVFVDFASGAAIPSTWTSNGWSTGGFGADKYIYTTSENAGEPSRLVTSRMVVADGNENLSVKAKKTTDAGTLVVYYAATKDGFTSENMEDISAQLNTENYTAVNVIIPEGMEYVAFDGYSVRINEIYGLANAPLMKVRYTAEGANLTSGMTEDFGLTASADSKTFYVVNESAGTLAGVDAALTGTGFTLTKTNLTAAGGDFTVAVDTSVKGYREATVTVSGTNQTDFVINLKGFVSGGEGKMHETFNVADVHPEGWVSDGFTATATGETLGENGSGTLRTTLMTVEANEKMAIRAKANKSSSLTDLKVKFYAKGAASPAATVDLSSALTSNTDEHTLYASIAEAGNYYVEFDGSYITLLEVAGFAYNANDPTIAVKDAENADVASGTLKDFGWAQTTQSATYKISNSGTGTLTISDITAPEGFTAATAGNVMTVNAGADPLVLTVTMTNAAIGDKSGTVTLTTDGGNFEIPVKGFVYGSKNFVDFTANEAEWPAGWSHGNWTIADGAATSTSSSTIETKKFTVAANEKLYVDIKGNNSAYDTKALSYSYSTDNGENWTDGTAALVESTQGVIADQVFTISDIADTEAVRTVLIRITGQNLGIKHIYGFTRVDEAIMTTTAADHDFGMQASDVTPADNAYVFTVTNDGNINLTNLAVTLEGAEENAFAVAVADNKTALTPGESVDVTVTMKSSTVYGAKNDNLTIAAEGQTPVVVALTGKTRDASKQYVDFTGLDAIPDGWIAGNWTVSTPPASSDKAAYAGAIESALITPALSIAAGEKLNFDARVTAGGSLAVSYTLDGGATWNNMANLVSANAMTAQVLDFGNTEAATAFVQFVGKSAYIDNVYGGVATTAALMDITTTEVADGEGKYDFGQDLMAEPAAKEFTITNIGSANLVAAIAATGNVAVNITATTGSQVGNTVTLANGETATISVTLPYDAAEAGNKSGTVTIGAATLNFIGRTIDNRTLNVDFADGQKPAGWYFGGNWSVNTFSKYAENNTNSTPGDLITQQLTVDGIDDDLTFEAAKTDNNYTFKVYTSQDRVDWTEFDLGGLSLTGSNQTVTINGLAAGNYFVKISGAFVKVDNFLGWKKVEGITRDLYVTETSFPAATQDAEANVNITATVTSLRADETGVYAKLFVDDAEALTAAAQDITLDGTKTFSFDYTMPTTPGTHTAQIKVYYSDNDEGFATAETDMHVFYVFNETIAPTVVDGGDSDAKLTRTLVGGWNTICLPFSMSAAQITATFGADAKVFAFNGLGAGNSLDFSSAGDMEAGTPYLIYVPDAVNCNAKVVEGISIDATEAGTSNTYFKGSFAPVAAPNLDGKYGVAPTNVIAKGNANTTMKGFRAYFENIPSDARISIYDETTGITRVYEAAELFGDNDKVYNLKGQRINNAKKGVYIVNGKQVVVK